MICLGQVPHSNYTTPAFTQLRRSENPLARVEQCTSTHFQCENCGLRNAKLQFWAGVLGYLWLFRIKKTFLLLKKRHKYPRKYPTQTSNFVLQKTHFAPCKRVLVCFFPHKDAVGSKLALFPYTHKTAAVSSSFSSQLG